MESQRLEIFCTKNEKSSLKDMEPKSVAIAYSHSGTKPSEVYMFILL
jgi:hypothetical protein